MRFSSYASRQTNKQTHRHIHHNTSHPSQARSKKTKGITDVELKSQFYRWETSEEMYIILHMSLLFLSLLSRNTQTMWCVNVRDINHVICTLIHGVSCYVMLLTVSKRWNRPLVSGDIPGARDGHSACVIRDKMFVFGGFEEGVCNNCVHVLYIMVIFGVFLIA